MTCRAQSEVCLPPGQIPINRRVVDEVAQIADLVGRLDQPGLRGQVRGVFDLQALALGLGNVSVAPRAGPRKKNLVRYMTAIDFLR